MHRDVLRRLSTLGYWIEGVLLGAWLAYWVVVDPKQILNSGWFWGATAVLAVVAIGLVVLYFMLRGEPDHLDALNQRANVDTAVRAKWK